jgi:hypothetical protein
MRMKAFTVPREIVLERNEVRRVEFFDLDPVQKHGGTPSTQPRHHHARHALRRGYERRRYFIELAARRRRLPSLNHDAAPRGAVRAV